jgi:hypothetical protein
MTPTQIKLAIAAALLVAAAAAGWTVNGWRLAGKVNELQGVVDTQAQALALLEASNIRCAAGVAEIQAAWKDHAAQEAARQRQAQEAMDTAARAAAGHLAAARAALKRPAPKAGEECSQVAAEAAAYVQRRKGGK